MGQAMVTSQFFIYGKRHFTQTGWQRASSSYPTPDVVENADLSDKCYLVTGANAGLGLQLAQYLASRGASTYMVCRNRERGEQARRAIANETKNQNVHLLLGDCGLKSDIQRIVSEFSQKERKLDGLVCNAGALTDARTLTPEGVESTLATHLLFGSYLLTQLCLPLLEASPSPRVVHVSSGGMYNVKFPSWEVATSEDGRYDGQMAYAYAKRGQVLLCKRLAEEHPKITFVSCHPGWVDTPGVDAAYGEKKSYLQPLRTPWEGAEGIAWLCVVKPEEMVSGAFYLDRTVQPLHIAGPFFTEGTRTKNTEEEVADLMTRLARHSAL